MIVRIGASLLALSLMATSAPARADTGLAAHKAVYKLSLSSKQPRRSTQTVQGRIFYDFSGSACQGYTLKFRQISDIQSEGKSVVNDLRATSWEDGDAKGYKFSSENLTDEKVTDTAEGRADRNSKAVDVQLSKPKRKALNLPGGVVFPSEQIKRVVEAARAGKTSIEMPLFDGSETGEKIFDTFTLIGRPIAPGHPPDDVAAKLPEMASLTRWPVSISYFERNGGTKQAPSEQTPAYVMNFELYENGVSRALVLDYPDFSVRGDLISLQMKKEKACK
jgi:envelope integrity protein B